jgi:hypothetical protein
VKTLIALVLFASVAHAESLEVSRRAVMQGRNEISTQLGFQASMGGATPAGPKLMFDYSRYMGSIVWLNFKLNGTFDATARGALCVDGAGRAYDCSVGFSGNGHAVDVLAGVKLKFPIARYKLVPYVNLNVGLVGIADRPAGDDGVAGIFRPGGGLKWFITPHVAVGGEIDIALGGAYYQQTCPNCANAHSEFYRAFDLGLGAEFIL